MLSPRHPQKSPRNVRPRNPRSRVWIFDSIDVCALVMNNVMQCTIYSEIDSETLAAPAVQPKCFTQFATAQSAELIWMSVWCSHMQLSPNLEGN